MQIAVGTFIFLWCIHPAPYVLIEFKSNWTAQVRGLFNRFPFLSIKRITLQLHRSSTHAHRSSRAQNICRRLEAITRTHKALNIFSKYMAEYLDLIRNTQISGELFWRAAKIMRFADGRIVSGKFSYLSLAQGRGQAKLYSHRCAQDSD